MLRESLTNLFPSLGKFMFKDGKLIPLLKYKFFDPSYYQTRNTVILKRRYPPCLKKVHVDWRSKQKQLVDKQRIYDVVQDTAKMERPPLKVLLIHPVEGVGQPGEMVEVDPRYGRNELLLPGLAVYPSPENIKKYEDIISRKDFYVPSSRYALQTVKRLEKETFHICMNLETPWKIEPWHVKVALRKGGFIAPESALTLPAKPITGPDLSLESKEFLVKVKINNKEEARVRFRLHHVATEQMNRLPWIENHWWKLCEPVFPEEAEVLNELNKKDPKIIKDEDQE